MIKLISTMGATIAVSLALISCQPESAVQPLNKKTIIDTCNKEWQLVELTTAKGMHPIVESTLPTLKCEPTGRVSGNAGVNRYFGTFVMMNNGAIEWPSAHLGSTMMAGSPALMQQEQTYLNALTKTNHIATVGNILVLSNKDRSISISYSAAKP
jgi:heat shock protein HslJ